ncbi:DUF4430 domain-containing protein [Floccifex sp.]|uniref:DUF4430 domain-containing protein n=1 Tax=Floccifex sp. TaxID=2815810 RepID=UPI003F038B03
MKKQNKIILTVALLLVLLAGIFIPKQLSKSSNDGVIDVVVEQVDHSIVCEKEVPFKEEQTCPEVIKENFDNVVIENGMIMSIETLTTPDDWSEFISIYVDDEMSEVGIEEIKLQDGMKISFVMTEYEY